MDVIGFEILKSLGRFFLHPLTYVFILVALWLGFQRVKRERKDFHTRVYDVIQQLTSPLFIALIFGAVVSVLTVVLGIEITVGMLALLLAVWLLFLPLRHARWLSITVAGSVALLITPLLPEGGTNWSWLNQWLVDIHQMDLLNMAWLFTLLFIAESFLILADGWKQTSPAIIKSKRGKMVGEHIASRLWFLPIFLVFPIGEWSGGSWWPLFDLSTGETFGLALVPFVLGFQAKVQGEYPIDGVKKIGKRLLMANILVIGLAIAAYFYSVIVFFVAAAILIGRELVYYSYKANDKQKISLFKRQETGLKILGLLPHSTADKMGLVIGEIIVKTNGRKVNSQRDFYDALQQNSAYCKLEVLDLQGELRFAQSSIFQGDHYQIGCLFVPDDEMGNLSYRGLRSSVVIHQDRTEVGKQQMFIETDKPDTILEKVVESIGELKPTTEMKKEKGTDMDDKLEDRTDDFDGEKANQEELAASEDSTEIQNDMEIDDKENSSFDEKEKVADNQSEKDAYETGSPYGQASALSNFYEELRQSKTKRNKWAPTLDENEKKKTDNDK